MSQHIGSQQGGVFYNAGRDQHIHGDHTAVVHSTAVTPEVLVAARDLRSALKGARLPPSLRAQAQLELDTVDDALATPQADQPRVAGALERLTGLLMAAGPLATAAATLVTPIETLAGWLGPAGQALLQMLPLVR